MLIRHLCGAILTLFLAANTFAALREHEMSTPREHAISLEQPQPAAAEFHLNSYSEHQPMIAVNVKPIMKADTLNEAPAAAATADMKDPLKYSVWVLIGLGPIMWIWLAFFPRIRRK